MHLCSFIFQGKWESRRENAFPVHSHEQWCKNFEFKFTSYDSIGDLQVDFSQILESVLFRNFYFKISSL